MSQAQTITLVVDELGTGVSTADHVYTRSGPGLFNRSTYEGPNHTLVVPDLMQLYRTPPKRSGDFLGTAKASIKFTQTELVADAKGNETAKPALVAVDMSLPIGMTDARKVLIIQRAIAGLQNEMALLLAQKLWI
jgi:hypothetical protein